jgi:hypothetical protein
MLRLVLVITCALVAFGCSKDPPCAQGPLSAEWQAAPLTGLVPATMHICQGSAATQASYWIDDTVHNSNMDIVDRAQSSGWDRTGDNWYDTTGDFNTPKWSEFSNESGALRVDVHEVNGGALVELAYTPRG